MRTFGGRRALTYACAFVALSVPASLLSGCSAAIDLAHSVQTKLGRIDAVTSAQVAAPSTDTGAAIAVTYTGADTTLELTDLLAEIDKVADDAEYPSYRLDLTPAGAADRLTVDDTFVHNPDQESVLDNWFAVTSALLGPVQYTFEPGSEEITVDAGAGIGHDVGEAGRLRYGFRNTTWTFENGATAFVVSGRVSPTDVTMFGAIQRSVGSQVLPAPAHSWRLERRARHVSLDLDVTLPGGPLTPDRVTLNQYGEAVHRLVDVAVRAVLPASLPVRLELRNPVDGALDVFGYWRSDSRPLRGRDPLGRGWDVWLKKVAPA